MIIKNPEFYAVDTIGSYGFWIDASNPNGESCLDEVDCHLKLIDSDGNGVATADHVTGIDNIVGPSFPCVFSLGGLDIGPIRGVLCTATKASICQQTCRKH